MNMRPKDAADVIAILEALDMPEGDLTVADGALSEIDLCDIWTRVYAIPHVFKLAPADRSGHLRTRAEGFAKAMLKFCAEETETDSTTAAVVELETLVLAAIRPMLAQHIEQVIALAERVAARFLKMTKVDVEEVPYLNLPGQIRETLFLAALANLIVHPAFLAALAKTCSDATSGSTLSVLTRSLTGDHGRLAALVSVTVLHHLDINGNGRILAQTLLALPRSSGLAEPDLAAKCAWLITFDPNNPERHGGAIRQELKYHTLFRLFSASSHHACVGRIGIDRADLARFTAYAWDIGLAACAPHNDRDGLAEALAERWDHTNRGGLRLRPERRKYIGGSNPASIWGLALGAVIAIRISRFCDGSSESKNRLLVLAVHAEDVVAKEHHRWLQNAVHRAVNDPTLSDEITSAVLFSRSAIRDTVRRGSVEPKEWLNLAESNTPWMLPVLVGWVEDFMLAPLDDASAMAWQNTIPAMLAMADPMDGWSAVDKLTAGLLGRFLCDPPIKVKGMPGWRIPIQADRTQVHKFWRNILVSPPESGRDWSQFEWLVTDPTVNSGIRAVASVERFLSPEDDETREGRPAWRTATWDALIPIFQALELNRWLRHRLLDLAIHPAGEMAGRLAVQLLVQLGQPADVTRLVNLLLSETADTIPDLDWKVSYAAEGLSSRANADRYSDAVRTRPIAPRERLIAEAKSACWLSQCAALLAFCPISPSARRQEFATSRRRQMGLHRSGVIDTKAVEDFRKESIFLAQGRSHLFPWMMEQLITDPLYGGVRVLHRNFWLRNSADHPAIPAIVALQTQGKDLRLFNAKTGKLTTQRSSLGPVAQGTLILSTNYEVAAIRQMPEDGQCFLAKGQRVDGLMKFTVEGKVEFSTIRASTNFALWDSDESRAWREESKKEALSNVVVQRTGHSWRPVEQGIHDLIASASDTVPFQAIITVAAAGRKWLFSTTPGTLFKLSEEHFRRESWLLLRKSFQQRNADIVGLRIRIRATRDRHTGRLSFEFENSDLDDSNLTWRSLFEEGEAVSVSGDGQGRFSVQANAELEPFPRMLRVEWEGPKPRAAERTVTGVVVGWDEYSRRQGVVRLAKAEVLKLKPPNEDLKALHSWALGLEVGSVLTLTSTIGRPNAQGNILAQTPERLAVQVAIDSLTLLPVAENLIRPTRPRRAVITWLQRREYSDVRLSIDAAQLVAFGVGVHKGIVLEKPTRGAEHTITSVLFIVFDAPHVVQATLASQHAPLLGSEVLVSYKNGQVQIRVLNLTVFAEALYDIDDRSAVAHSALCVGMLNDRGNHRQVWVDPEEPHKLVLAQGDALPLFQPRHVHAGYHPSLPALPWPSCYNQARTPIYDSASRSVDVFVRVPRLNDNSDDEDPNHINLAGWCEGAHEVGAYHVREIEFRKVRLEGGHSAVRRFFLGYRLEVPSYDDERPEPRVARPELNRDKDLTTLSESGIPLNVIAIPGDAATNWRALVPELQGLGHSRAQAILPVPASELHHFHYGREFRDVTERAVAMIHRANEGWHASFSAVKPKTLEQFKEDCPVELGMIYTPPALLFVGRTADGDSCHLEYGIGHVVAVPMERLLIDERPFRDLSSVLFFGDRIKKLKFTREENRLLRLEIVEIDIEFGAAHQVYLQAKNWRFVHTLVLESGNNNQPIVVSVNGYNDGAEHAQRDFSLHNASLSADGTQELQRQLAAAGHPVSTYAKLNISKFVATDGTVCEFEPVPFVFGPGGIDRGDMLLVEAGTMQRTKRGNDIRLNLSPLSGVDLAGATELFVLRREFSAREALMSRYLGPNESSSRTLCGMIFAVRVSVCFDHGGARASMLELPPRKWRVLIGALRAAGGSLFATVAALPTPADEDSNREALTRRLELRPGMFFELLASHLEEDLPSNCSTGTLLRIELQSGNAAPQDAKVRLVACQFSPLRYLTSAPDRWSFLLPLDLLLKDGAHGRGSSIETFTALDFPGLRFSAFYWHDRDGRWNGTLNSADLTAIMSCPHPRFALLGRILRADGVECAALLPVSREAAIPVGRLAWDTAGGLWFQQLGGDDVLVSWLQMSFADVTVSILKMRSSKRQWFAHDAQTGHWTGEQAALSYPVEPISSAEGPLFASLMQGQFGLRYREEELETRGVPFCSIINTFGLDALDGGGETVRVTVAATSKTDAGVYEGIWVEWAPGRVIELPVSMLSWRSGPELLTLTSLDWSHLCCGDELDIKLLPGDTLAPDQIEVLAWYRGQRSAGIGYPTKRTLLPLAARASDGSIVVGSGKFKMTLPYVVEGEIGSAWFLTDSNHLVPANIAQLAPRDVVLITLQGDNVTIAGASRLTALLSPHDDCAAFTEGHPLGALLMGRDEEGRRFCRLPNLRTLIIAAGGALAVTVEWVDRNAARVMVSFRRQMPSIKAGCFTQGVVTEALDPQWACMRIGSGILYLRGNIIVDGVPDKMSLEALELLSKRDIPVWIRTPTEGGEYLCGCSDDSLGDLWVEPIGVCGQPTKPGLIVRSCRSQRLYWVAHEHLAWCDLSAELIQQGILEGPKRYLQANLYSDDDTRRLSLIRTNSARRENRYLRPGHQMQGIFVAAIEEKADATKEIQQWLVSSQDTDLLMRCEVPNSLRFVVGENSKVEIASRRYARTPRVVCAPQGYRRHPIELPSGQLEQWQAVLNGHRIRVPGGEVAARCAVMEETDLRSGPSEATLLEDKLIWAQELCVHRRRYAPWIAQVALSWCKEGDKESVRLLDALRSVAVLCQLVANGADAMRPARRDQAINVLTECWAKVQKTLERLHSRSLRSVHLVTISTHLSAIMQENDRRCVEACRRLLSLLERPMFEAQRHEFIQLNAQLLMEHGHDRHELAGAFHICLGMSPPPQAMPACSQAPVTPPTMLGNLARVCSPYVMNHPTRLGHEPATTLSTCFAAFIETVSEWPFVAWLLPPLPPVVW